MKISLQDCGHFKMLQLEPNLGLNNISFIVCGGGEIIVFN
jgi:hypothetical protein